ncbi:site-specific integrase, partial [Fulvimarina sp. MAC3]|uniref:tyrosine-type recombinase/integrase n=1 Tax=Fulvimarina sp. MAC3 TaxID=3148887 RepID=UPI0031FBDCEA
GSPYGSRLKSPNSTSIIHLDGHPRSHRQRRRNYTTYSDANLSQSFRNEKHIAQWYMTLTHYAASLRDMPLEEISTDDVLAVLSPIWRTKNETASRLRGRIERVLDAAKARGLRSGENPARWRGHLELLLPKRQKLQRGHHAAMPYNAVPKFFSELQNRPALAASALELTILTAARSGEVLGATWDEIDFETRVWTVPADRMKAGRVHRVPLSDQAMKIILAMRTVQSNDHIFPGQKAGRPLSNMSMEMAMRRMNLGHLTVHGFRSSFRDWVGEETEFARELAEAALAHIVGDQTERAYRRGDALEKRRALMEAWAQFCMSNEKNPA